MHGRRLVASIGVLASAVVVAPVTFATPGDAAARPRATVEIADTATLSPDGQTVTIEVTASCARKWQVLEAFVTVSQPQTFGMGGIPLTCTGRPRTFTVNVTSLDVAFEPGDAQASALLLIERRGRTQQAQDSEVVQLA